MDAKKYIIPHVSVLDALDLSSNEIIMESKALRIPVMHNNWPAQYPYIPITVADIAYSDSGIYCRFWSKGIGLRAEHSEDGQKVHEDSCVELFLQLPRDDFYYNFEFNCIGTCDASRRQSKEKSKPFGEREYALVQRSSSERKDMIFERPQGIHRFWVSIKIPFELLGIDPKTQLPEYIMANFYKCGDKTPVPHFASWMPIESEKPNFHKPEFFQKLYLGER